MTHIWVLIGTLTIPPQIGHEAFNSIVLGVYTTQDMCERSGGYNHPMQGLKTRCDRQTLCTPDLWKESRGDCDFLDKPKEPKQPKVTI